MATDHQHSHSAKVDIERLLDEQQARSLAARFKLLTALGSATPSAHLLTRGGR